MKIITLIILLILPHQYGIATPQQNVEAIFATSTLLANSDAITLGIANFDPVDVLNHPIGSADSIELRNQLSVYSLPYLITLFENEHYQDNIKLSLSYIQQEQHQIINKQSSDNNKDTIISISLGYQRHWFIDENWTIKGALNSYLMTYNNQHTYSALSETFKDQVEGNYYNIRSNSYQLEPAIGVSYQQPKNWGKWSYESHFSPFYGWTFAGNEATRGANPSGWEWVNSVKGYFDIHADKYAIETAYLKASRIDIGGDMRPSFNTNEYYELGLGILLDSQYFQGWIDNVGIGLNLNIGSSLSGGSLVIYFKE